MIGRAEEPINERKYRCDVGSLWRTQRGNARRLTYCCSERICICVFKAEAIVFLMRRQGRERCFCSWTPFCSCSDFLGLGFLRPKTPLKTRIQFACGKVEKTHEN